jgi:hypothetical protein
MVLDSVENNTLRPGHIPFIYCFDNYSEKSAGLSDKENGRPLNINLRGRP